MTEERERGKNTYSLFYFSRLSSAPRLPSPSSTSVGYLLHRDSPSQFYFSIFCAETPPPSSSSVSSTPRLPLPVPVQYLLHIDSPLPVVAPHAPIPSDPAPIPNVTLANKKGPGRPQRTPRGLAARKVTTHDKANCQA